MIKSILDLTENLAILIVKQFQKEIRREVEYNAEVVGRRIANGVKEGVDYARKELMFTLIVTFTLLLGALFIMYGASVFLDTVIFKKEGVGFLIIGALSLFISLLLILSRKR